MIGPKSVSLVKIKQPGLYQAKTSNFVWSGTKKRYGLTVGNSTSQSGRISNPLHAPSVSTPHFFWLISLFSWRKKLSRWEQGMLPERMRTAGKSKRRRPAFLWSPGRKFAPSTCLMHLVCFLPGNTHAKSSRARPHTFTRNATHTPSQSERAGGSLPVGSFRHWPRLANFQQHSLSRHSV